MMEEVLTRLLTKYEWVAELWLIWQGGGIVLALLTIVAIIWITLKG